MNLTLARLLVLAFLKGSSSELEQLLNEGLGAYLAGNTEVGVPSNRAKRNWHLAGDTHLTGDLHLAGRF